MVFLRSFHIFISTTTEDLRTLCYFTNDNYQIISVFINWLNLLICITIDKVMFWHLVFSRIKCKITLRFDSTWAFKEPDCRWASFLDIHEQIIQLVLFNVYVWSSARFYLSCATLHCLLSTNHCYMPYLPLLACVLHLVWLCFDLLSTVHVQGDILAWQEFICMLMDIGGC